MKKGAVPAERAARSLEATIWWVVNDLSNKPIAGTPEFAKRSTRLQSSLSVAVLQRNGDFPYDLRELHFGLRSRPSHRVLFTITGTTVIVLTVRHVAQQAVQPNDLE